MTRKVVVINIEAKLRTLMEQAFSVEGFELFFADDLEAGKDMIEQVQPCALIHDFGPKELEENRQFQLKFASTPFEWDMARVILIERITEQSLAFANDAKIAKVFARGSSVLSMSVGLGMCVSAQSNLSDVQRDIRNMRMAGSDISEEEIDEKIEEAYEKFAHDPEVKTEYANLELKRDHPESAEHLAQELLEENEQNVRAMNILARSYMKQGKQNQAIGILEKADVLSPKNTDRLVELGNALFKNGDLGKAKKCFASVLEIDDQKTEAAAGMGKIHLSEGDASAAIELFSNSLSEEEAAAVFNNAAVGAVKEGDFEKAFELYASAFKCLKTDKYRPKILYNLGLAQKKSGAFKDAITTFEEVVSIDPQFTKAVKQIQAIRADLDLKKSLEDA